MTAPNDDDLVEAILKHLQPWLFEGHQGICTCAGCRESRKQRKADNARGLLRAMLITPTLHNFSADQRALILETAESLAP